MGVWWWVIFVVVIVAFCCWVAWLFMKGTYKKTVMGMRVISIMIMIEMIGIFIMLLGILMFIIWGPPVYTAAQILLKIGLLAAVPAALYLILFVIDLLNQRNAVVYTEEEIREVDDDWFCQHKQDAHERAEKARIMMEQLLEQLLVPEGVTIEERATIQADIKELEKEVGLLEAEEQRLDDDHNEFLRLLDEITDAQKIEDDLALADAEHKLKSLQEEQLVKQAELDAALEIERENAQTSLATLEDKKPEVADIEEEVGILKDMKEKAEEGGSYEDWMKYYADNPDAAAYYYSYYYPDAEKPKAEELDEGDADQELLELTLDKEALPPPSQETQKLQKADLKDEIKAELRREFEEMKDEIREEMKPVEIPTPKTEQTDNGRLLIAPTEVKIIDSPSVEAVDDSPKADVAETKKLIQEQLALPAPKEEKPKPKPRTRKPSVGKKSYADQVVDKVSDDAKKEMVAKQMALLAEQENSAELQEMLDKMKEKIADLENEKEAKKQRDKERRAAKVAAMRATFSRENVDKHIRKYFIELAACFLMNRDSYKDKFGLSPYNRVVISETKSGKKKVTHSILATKDKLYKFAELLIDVDRFFAHPNLYPLFVELVNEGTSLVRISEKLHLLYLQNYRKDFAKDYRYKEDFENILVLTSHHYIAKTMTFKPVFTPPPAFDVKAALLGDEGMAYLSDTQRQERFEDYFPNYRDLGFESASQAYVAAFAQTQRNEVEMSTLVDVILKDANRTAKALERLNKASAKAKPKAVTTKAEVKPPPTPKETIASVKEPKAVKPKTTTKPKTAVPPKKS